MDVTQSLKDTAYIAVGLGVLGFQRAQVARREIITNLGNRERLDAQVSGVKAQVAKVVANLEEVLEPAAKELEGRLNEVEEHLPEQVKAIVASARQAAEIAADQLRSILAA